MTRIGFLLFYVLGMVPTYILPYFGSNSVMAQSLVGALSKSTLGLTWTALHVGALTLCIYVAWARGCISGKKALVALPVVAAVFDMVPVLSSIPLVPTVMHVIALVVGFGGNDEAAADVALPKLAARPLLGVAGLAGVTLLTWAGLLLSAGHTTSKLPKEVRAGGTLADEKFEARINSMRPKPAAPAVTATPSVSISSSPTPQPAVQVGQPQAPTPQASLGAIAVQHESVPAIQMATPPQPAPVVATAAAPPPAPSASEIRAREFAQQTNRYLATADAARVANEYLDSYIGFLAIGDTTQAVRLFNADFDPARQLAAYLAQTQGQYRVVMAAPAYKAAVDPALPGTLHVKAVITPSAQRVGERTVEFYLTVSPANRFVAVHPR